MTGRRLLYLAVLTFCGCFYIAYGQWLAWLLLVWMLLLPWLSLVLSLRAMVNFRLEPAGPDALEMGRELELWLLGTCRAPMPPFTGKLRLRSCFTPETCRYTGAKLLPHCGGWTVTVEKGRVYDYLGLFSFPVAKCESRVVPVRPRPVPVADFPDAVRRTSRIWRPRPGGGYGENHELRLYRPGDSLNQIHWKLSAKTGKLIYRQSMERCGGKILLTLHLRGTAEELDRKLGRLLWVGNRLLEQNTEFELQALTGSGTLTFPVDSPRTWTKTMDILLCQKVAGAGDLTAREPEGFWHYHIGGAADEA